MTAPDEHSTAPDPEPGPRLAPKPVFVGPVRRRGWPVSAKLTTFLLVLATAAAVVVGIAASSGSSNDDSGDLQRQLAAARADADEAKAAAATAQQQATGVQDDLQRAQDDLSDAASDLADARAQRDVVASTLAAVRQLFPIGLDDVVASPIQGQYRLTVVPDSAVCTGYADNDEACGPTGFPTSFEIGGDAEDGLTVSSPFFAAVDLRPDTGRLVGEGDVLAAAADICADAPAPTTFTITITVGEVGLDAQDHIDATVLDVEFSMGAEASSQCTATTRSARFTATPA